MERENRREEKGGRVEIKSREQIERERAEKRRGKEKKEEKEEGEREIQTQVYRAGTDRFFISNSTEKSLEAFVTNIRQSWGRKLYDDYDVRVLPDVEDDQIYSITLGIKGKSCDFIFQRNNAYFISWGKSPKEMIIFDDAVETFKKAKERFMKNEQRGGELQRSIPGTDRSKPASEHPTQISQCGKQFQLSKAIPSGIKFDYKNLQSKGKLRHQIKIGKMPLENSVHAFISSFVPEKQAGRNQYVDSIRKSTTSFLHIFPEAVRNDEIFKEVLKIYVSGGNLSEYVVGLANDWSKFSNQIHESLPDPTQKPELWKNMKLVMKERQEDKGGKKLEESEQDKGKGTGSKGKGKQNANRV